MEGKFFAGIDVGATSIKAGVVNDSNKVFEKIEPPTPKTHEAILKTLNKILTIFAAHHPIEAIGIGLPGLVDYESQKLLFAPNLKLENLDLETEIPLFIGNDADMALLGEIALRRELKKEKVALLTIGTGVGGAFAMDGKMPFEFNLAGEVGHMKIVVGGRECSCGQKGCLQAYISGNAILEQARKTISPSTESAKEVFELLEKGNEKADRIIFEMSEMLGVGIANLVNVLAVEKIILAGKISRSAETILKFMHESDQNNIFAFEKRKFSIEKSKNIDEIGIIGAARFAKIKHFDKRPESVILKIRKNNFAR